MALLTLDWGLTDDDLLVIVEDIPRFHNIVVVDISDNNVFGGELRDP